MIGQSDNFGFSFMIETIKNALVPSLKENAYKICYKRNRDFSNEIKYIFYFVSNLMIFFNKAKIKQKKCSVKFWPFFKNKNKNSRKITELGMGPS